MDTEKYFSYSIIFSNRPTSTTNDDEQKSVYKKILRGGDIPTSGLQKVSINNRGRHMG